MFLYLPPPSLSVRSPINNDKQHRNRAARCRRRHGRRDDRWQHQPSLNETSNETCHQTCD